MPNLKYPVLNSERCCALACSVKNDEKSKKKIEIFHKKGLKKISV